MPLPNFAAIFAISGLIQKKLFAGYKVPMLPFATQGLLLFWEGASLGRSRRNEIKALVKTLVGSEAIAVALQGLGTSYETALARAADEEWILAYVDKVAQDGLTHYDRIPESLLDLFATSFAPPELDFRDIDRLYQLGRRSIAVEQAALQGSGWFVAGISFGYTQPELSLKLCREPYGQRDPLWWSDLKRGGGIGPPVEGELATMGVGEAGEQLTLAMVETYADQHFPEIKMPLGLA